MYKPKYFFKSRLKIIFFLALDNLLHFIKSKKKLPDSILKILLVKTDHIGDMIMTTSILPLLKIKYPSAEIDIICASWSKEILKNNPYINNIYIIDHFILNRGNTNTIHKVIRFLVAFLITIIFQRKKGHDIVLFLRTGHGSLQSLSFFLKKKCCIGHNVNGFGPLMDIEVEWKDHLHETEHYLEILTPLGITTSVQNLSYEIYPTREDFGKISLYLKKEKVTDYIVIHPGSGDKRRALNENYIQKIIDGVFAKNKSSCILITGSSAENANYDNIKNNFNEAFHTHIKNCCGNFSLTELSVLFQRAKRIYCVESMASHLAGFSKVETIEFYGGMTDYERFKPLGENITIVTNPVICSPCGIGCATMQCMNFDNFFIKK